MNSTWVSKILSAFDLFWRHHPALLYALAALIGIHAALDYALLLLIVPVLVIWAPLLSLKFKESRALRRRLYLALIVACGFYGYVKVVYLYPQLEPSGLEGTARIRISALRQVNSFQGKSWKYSGTIHSFIPNDSQEIVAAQIPYTLFVSGQNHPEASSDYFVQGVLKEWRAGYYIIKPKKGVSWIPVPNSWSFAEARLKMKQKVVKIIQDCIFEKRTAGFLAGLVTGEFDDGILSFEFSRFGLQHIMAISGFHFGIIASILGFFLQLIFSKNVRTILLLLALTLYFIFLGPACSIMRAWVTISIYLIGHLFDKRSFGLNSLGIALLALLFYEPISYRSLAFQFSVLTTASIILYVPIVSYFVEKVWVKRSYSEVVSMNLFNQHGYAVLGVFRQGFCLCLAVNMAAFPLTLYYFHKFPLMSLVYNLFFPFLVSISVFLLIAGLAVGMVCPYVGQGIHYLNTLYSSFILDFTYNMPTTVDYFYRIGSFSSLQVVGYLTLLFGAGVVLHAFLKHEKAQPLYLT